MPLRGVHILLQGDVEETVKEPTALQYMLFDHRNGLDSVLYLVNEGTTATQTALNFTGPVNQSLGNTTVTLPSLWSQIIDLASVVPATIGQQGTITISSSGALVTGYGLIPPTVSLH